MSKLIFSVVLFFCIIISCSDTPSGTKEEEVLVKDIKKELVEETVIAKEEIIEIDSTMIDTTPVPKKVERPSRKPAIMEFEVSTHNYDTIQEGEIIEYSFKFKNTGERPLSIKDVVGSCGCTIGSYPFLDIAPNEENVIKARFDSKGKKGIQNTTVTVYSNASPSEVVLSLKGFVLE